MKEISKLGKWLSVCALAVATLTACDKSPPDYSGKYEILMGQNCDMIGAGDAYLELALSGKDQDRRYVVHFPSAAQVGLSALSEPGSFNDSNELTVFFTESTKGLFVDSSKTLSLTLEPHESKPDHLWITRWEGEALTNGVVSAKEDVLGAMLKKYNNALRDSAVAQALKMDLSNTAICVGNTDRLSSKERTARRDAAEARTAALVAGEVASLKALPFEGFWAIGEGCKETPLTTTCQAYRQLFKDRLAQERIDAEAKVNAMPESDLKRLEQECKAEPWSPQCDAYDATMKEREAANTERLREELTTMNYTHFSSQENAYCTNERSPDCRLYRSLKRPKRADEIARLADNHTGQELLDLKWSACNSASPGYTRNDDLCKFRREVTQSKRTLQEEYYRNNQDALREDHNACFEEYQALRLAKKSKEANTLITEFRCMTALDGARYSGHKGRLTSPME